MFKENKETPMVVLIVLFIVFSVLILVLSFSAASYEWDIPGMLVVVCHNGNIINHVQLQRSKGWQNCDELS